MSLERKPDFEKTLERYEAVPPNIQTKICSEKVCLRARVRRLLRIEALLGVPVDMISVGPERDQAIVTRNIFGGTL